MFKQLLDSLEWISIEMKCGWMNVLPDHLEKIPRFDPFNSIMSLRNKKIAFYIKNIFFNLEIFISYLSLSMEINY